MESPNRLAKEPWLAVNLSCVLPGVGQFYAGAWGLGILFLLGGLLLPAFAIGWLASSGGSLAVGGLLGLGSVALGVLTLLHAHVRARKANDPAAEQARKQVKDPYLAVFLTQVLPGIGHLYLRRWVVGILLIVVSVGLWIIPPWTVLVYLAIYAPIVCLLAWRAAPPERRQGKAAIAALCLAVAAKGLLVSGGAVVFRYGAVEAFRQPAESMAPTLEAGERILVSKRPFQPQRGDLVVFRNPQDRSQVHVKRVAALGGETVEYKADGICVNGSRLQEGTFGRLPYLPDPGQKFAGAGKPFTVPPGHLFVVGDNCRKSLDSRVFGPVPQSDVIGKPYKRYWPPSRAGAIE